MPMTTAVIGLMLGFGALQELFVRGIWRAEAPSLLIGAAGSVVSALLLVAALAMWRRWDAWPRVAALAGALSVAFHVYAALPPIRIVGNFALVAGVGIGVALLARAIRAREDGLHVVR